MFIKKCLTNSVLILSVALSFGIGIPAAAMAATPMSGMAHENASIINCINEHRVAPGAAEKIVIDQLKDVDDEPLPKQFPYFVQFKKAYAVQRQDVPKDIICSPSYDPPDIIRSTSNIRF